MKLTESYEKDFRAVATPHREKAKRRKKPCSLVQFSCAMGPKFLVLVSAS